MAHDVMGMINGAAGVLSRDLTGTGIKRQTDLIPRPRPSTGTRVTLCRKGAEVAAAVPWAGFGNVCWISRRCFQLDTAD